MTIQYYWTQTPGTFVDKLTGTNKRAGSWIGSIQHWYETLIPLLLEIPPDNFFSYKVCAGLVAHRILSLTDSYKTINFTNCPDLILGEIDGFPIFKDDKLPNNLLEVRTIDDIVVGKIHILETT